MKPETPGGQRDDLGSELRLTDPDLYAGPPELTLEQVQALDATGVIVSPIAGRLVRTALAWHRERDVYARFIVTHADGALRTTTPWPECLDAWVVMQLGERFIERYGPAMKMLARGDASVPSATDRTRPEASNPEPSTVASGDRPGTSLEKKTPRTAPNPSPRRRRKARTEAP